MDLNYSPEDIAFRDEVRSFLETSLPKEITDKIARGEPPMNPDRMISVKVAADA